MSFYMIHDRYGIITELGILSFYMIRDRYGIITEFRIRALLYDT